MKVDIRLDGMDETIHSINTNDRDLIHDLEKIVKRGATRTVKVAKSLAPKGKTGNLRKSIRTRDVSRDIGLRDRLAKTVTPRGKRGRHFFLNELGTQERIQNSTGRRTGSMPARPFMDRAVQQATPNYVREVEARIKREVII